ncbi:hypothetical protein [Streptomyces mutabilis]|uniref:hypothetical protein n=1 Tax=Streptomyces mutabilis TaxID=67332 RepID=UPI000B0754F0|nr:hypothetical protein [Streptomyces mutabilis]
MPGAKTAVAWLASVAPDPESCRREWERNPLGVAPLPAGKAWDVLVLPSRLGSTTLGVLSRILDRPGPVLVDFGDARTGFLVPAGTAARWTGTGVRTAGLGTWIVVPHPGGVSSGLTALASATRAADADLVRNGGFESGLDGWNGTPGDLLRPARLPVLRHRQVGRPGRAGRARGPPCAA